MVPCSRMRRRMNSSPTNEFVGDVCVMMCVMHRRMNSSAMCVCAMPHKRQWPTNSFVGQCGRGPLWTRFIRGSWMSHNRSCGHILSMNLYHITWATYCSRQPRKTRKRLSMPAVRLSAIEQVAVAQSIRNTIREHSLDVAAFTVCEDHVHVLLACEATRLQSSVKLLKGCSARFVRSRYPDSHATTKHLWGRHFYALEIDSPRYLENVTRYIHGNRERHGLPYNEELEGLLL